MPKVNYFKKILWLAAILIPLCTLQSCEEKKSTPDDGPDKKNTAKSVDIIGRQVLNCKGADYRELLRSHYVEPKQFNDMMSAFFVSLGKPNASFKTISIDTIIRLLNQAGVSCSTHAVELLIDTTKADNKDITFRIYEKPEKFIRPFLRISLFVAILDSFKLGNIKEIEFSKGLRYDSAKKRNMKVVLYKVMGKNIINNSDLLYQGDYSTEDPEYNFTK